MHWGSHVEVPVYICGSSEYQEYKLFERLFAREFACDAGDPGSILGRDIVVSFALEEDGDELGQFHSWYCFCFEYKRVNFSRFFVDA